MKLRDLRNHYDSLDGIDKRILLKDLGVKMIRTHKQVRIEANEPLNQILNPKLAKIPSEPELRSMGITKKDLQSPEMINWLPNLDRFRTLNWNKIKTELRLSGVLQFIESLTVSPNSIGTI